MDNSNQTPPQEPINNLPPQPPSPVGEPQAQGFVGFTPPPAKSRRRLVIAVVVILFLVAAGAAAWFALGNKDKPKPSEHTEQNHQESQVTENSEGCAYVPEDNHAQNEGVYGQWRDNAKKVDFDVYLPCEFHKDFRIAELGISGGDSDEVVNVFLRFNRPEPAEGEDGLPDDSTFYIRKLPSIHQPPAQCIDSFSFTQSDIHVEDCTKAGDTDLGTVYENDEGDLYLVIDDSLIIWSAPPYDDSGDVKPMLDILNSLKKVDPTKLEFFNGQN